MKTLTSLEKLTMCLEGEEFKYAPQTQKCTMFNDECRVTNLDEFQ